MWRPGLKGEGTDGLKGLKKMNMVLSVPVFMPWLKSPLDLLDY